MDNVVFWFASIGCDLLRVVGGDHLYGRVCIAVNSRWNFGLLICFGILALAGSALPSVMKAGADRSDKTD